MSHPSPFPVHPRTCLMSSQIGQESLNSRGRIPGLLPTGIHGGEDETYRSCKSGGAAFVDAGSLGSDQGTAGTHHQWSGGEESRGHGGRNRMVHRCSGQQHREVWNHSECAERNGGSALGRNEGAEWRLQPHRLGQEPEAEHDLLLRGRDHARRRHRDANPKPVEGVSHHGKIKKMENFDFWPRLGERGFSLCATLLARCPRFESALWTLTWDSTG